MIEQILQADRMLQVDQVDRARALYARVVELDPSNAIAVVGLAQCALADGDDRAAYELASRALELDPENDMARRMEARLSEVMAARGEAVERPAAASRPAAHAMRPVITGDEPASMPAPAPARPGPGAPAAGGPAPPTPPKRASRRSLVDRLLGR